MDISIREERTFILIVSIWILTITSFYVNLCNKEHLFYTGFKVNNENIAAPNVKPKQSNAQPDVLPDVQTTDYDVHDNYTGYDVQIMEVTAYNATVEQCGKDDGITASGTVVTEGRTVACNDFPFGTKLLIGENVYVVEDRCGYDNVVDIYFDSYDDAISWGRRTMEVTVVE